MSVAMRHGIVSAVGRVAVYPVMLAGECERASDCKPPMPWSERGWAPTGPSWSGRALTCRTGHCSFVTDGDNSTSALHAISAALHGSPVIGTSGAAAPELAVLRGEAVVGRRLLSMARRWAALR